MGGNGPFVKLRRGIKACSKLIPQVVCALWSLVIGCTKSYSRPVLTLFSGNVAMKSLWDSGSQISLIDHRKVAEISRICPQNVRRLPTPQKVSLSTANKGQLDVLALYHIELQTKQKKRISGTFYVVRNLAVEVIIGCDIMASHNVEINVNKKRVKIGGVSKDKNKMQAPSILDFIAQRDVKLNPKEEISLTLKIPRAFQKETEVYFESLQTDPEVIIQEAISPVNIVDGLPHIPVVIINLSHDTKWLKKGHVMGKLYRSTEFQTFEIDSLANQVNLVQTKSPEFTMRDINLDDVPEKYKWKYLDTINRYRDVFSRGKLEVGDCPIMPHVIKLKDPTKVVSIPPYRMPYHLQDVAKEYVENLLKANIIRRSVSPFSSPLMLVRKQNADPSAPVTQQYRVVHNYKKVNLNIERCAYPLRNLYELLDNVSKGKVYTVIDLSQGYFNQKCVDPMGATAFSLPSVGHFEYVKSPMGINSSPAFFQRLLDFITQGLENVYVYMDDVILSTHTFEENLIALEATLKRFRKYKMKCNLSKTKFGAGEVQYLGYNISNTGGIRPGKMKTEKIKQFKPPSNVTEIKQFLGLCSFFRRVIPNFSSISAPLTKLTRKDSMYKKGPLPQIAMASFRSLQKALCARPCVEPVDFNREFIVTVDTSQTATGAILSQIDGEGVERANAYFSKLLNDCDSRKSAYHREQLGILAALKHFKPYLFGRHFRLRTDHKPLAVSQTGKLDVLDRIAQNIKEFEPFTIEYLKGSEMHADYLSRPPEGSVVENCAAVTRQQLAKMDKQKKFEPWLLDPLPISDKEIYASQQADKRIKALAIALKHHSKPTAEILRSFVNTWLPACYVKNGLVVDKQDRIFLPDSLRQLVLETYHDKMGHKSAKSTLEAITQQFVWPEMKNEIQTYCKSCNTCSKVKPPHKYEVAPLRSPQPATTFNYRIHVDCLTNLTPTLSNNYTACLVIVDAYSGFTMAKSIKKPNAENTMEVLVNQWISNYGVPHELISDGGSEFRNNMFKETCDKLNIRHIITSPLHSRSNGLAERKIRQVVEFLRLYTQEGERGENEWDLLLPSFTWITNMVKSSRGFSPYFLVFNREPKFPIAQIPGYFSYAETSLADKFRILGKISKDVLDSQELHFLANKLQHDKRARDLCLKPGDKVFVDMQKGQNRKLDMKFAGPYLVLENFLDHVIIKEPFTTKTIKVHKDRIKLGSIRDQCTDVTDSLVAPNYHVGTRKPVQEKRTRANPDIPEDDPLLALEDEVVGQAGNAPHPGPAQGGRIPPAGAPDHAFGPNQGAEEPPEEPQQEPQEEEEEEFHQPEDSPRGDRYHRDRVRQPGVPDDGSPEPEETDEEGSQGERDSEGPGGGHAPGHPDPGDQTHGRDHPTPRASPHATPVREPDVSTGAIPKVRRPAGSPTPEASKNSPPGGTHGIRSGGGPRSTQTPDTSSQTVPQQAEAETNPFARSSLLRRSPQKSGDTATAKDTGATGSRSTGSRPVQSAKEATRGGGLRASSRRPKPGTESAGPNVRRDDPGHLVRTGSTRGRAGGVSQGVQKPYTPSRMTRLKSKIYNVAIPDDLVHRYPEERKKRGTASATRQEASKTSSRSQKK